MAKRLVFWVVFGFILLCMSVVISLSVGSAHIPVAETWRVIVHQVPLIGGFVDQNWEESTEQILLNVRAPRVLLALLVGAALALAGTGFQGVLRNPLAEPYTLGVASGAAVGALTVILLGWQYAWAGNWTIPLAAFFTGLVTLWIVFILSKQEARLKVETLILAGVVIQAFFGSVVSFLISMSRNSMNEMMYWLMGSLALKDWTYSLVIAPYLLIGIFILLMYGRELNLFSLGERHASHLGVNIERTKIIVLVTATLLTAAAVSVAGVISFVGLVIPHILRLLVGPDYRLLIPLSVIYGAIYVLWADTLSRMLLDPQVIPLGVITSILGAPFFAWLLVKNKRTLQG
jgi:iron complex transport system permease protein